MKRLLLITLMTLGALGLFAQDQPVRVRALIEKAELYKGEAMMFRIEVNGSQTADQPKLPKIDGVSLQFLGGTDASQRSISIINGRRTDNTVYSYHMNYQLTASKVGDLTIPSLAVTVDGATYNTQPITIRVKEPEKTDDIKLFVSLSEKQAILGQPVDLTVTFAFKRSVREFNLDLPFLNDPNLAMEDITGKGDPRQMHQLQANGQLVIMRQDERTIGGEEHMVLYFKKRLYPQKAGTYSFKGASATCEALVGRQRSRDPFDDFFSFGRDRGVYQRVEVFGSGGTLTVKPLPADGQPANFSGNIGDMALSVSAEPTEVKVGDPITLTMTVSGPRLAETIKAPPLSLQDNLTKDFKVPEETAAGEVKGKIKVFTQTIRAKRDAVTEIPPLELSYFDPEAGEYRSVFSEAIPLSVEATRMVTAFDAEGTVESEPAEAGSTPESLAGGIGANYYGKDLLKAAPLATAGLFRAPLVYLWVLPALFLVLFAGRTLSGRRSQEASRLKAARSALDQALKEAETLEADEACGVLLAAFLDFLAASFGRGAVTSLEDVEEELRKQGLSAVELADLKDQVATWEGARYGGVTASRQELMDGARELKSTLLGRLS